MTLDATVGGAASDSYLTVAVADAMAEADMGPEATLWLASTTDTDAREKALKRATREIDGYVRSGWPKYDASQALQFPRSIDVASSTAYIPADIAQAAYHQAAYALKNAATIDRASATHARRLGQFSEPNVSGTLDEEMVNIISPRAMHYLSAFEKTAPTRSGRGLGSVRFSSGFAT